MPEPRRYEDGDIVSDEEEKRLPRRPTLEELHEAGTSEKAWTDEFMARATELAAGRLDAMDKAGEQITESRHQQPVFRDALWETQDGLVDSSEIRLDLPNWEPSPGGVDIIVRDKEGKPRVAAELKLWKTDWMLWDALKMIDALNLDDLEAAYMVMGTTQKGWESRFRHCPADGKTTELFAPGVAVHDTRKLFEENAHAWYDLLYGGTARPTRVRSAIKTELIFEAPLSFDGKPGSLRTVRVEPASDEWISFSEDWYQGEWPIGVQPCGHYLEWRQAERVQPTR